MTPQERREFIEAVSAIPAKHRAWLASDDIELFAYYGWGLVLNDAQLDACRAVFDLPPGIVHLWRMGNRTGKTTGSDIVHLLALWRKWRYENADLTRWLDYLYRTLHAAPQNRLMGKAWELIDSLIAGSAIHQRNPITNRQRPALLAPFFTAGKSTNRDGSEALWIKCANGAQLDFLSTHDGAGRMESEAWWLITWDEFVRQQPVDDIPILFDQTFLPRSSDFMAPLILSGTATEDSDPIYAELEDIAEENKADWHLVSYGREANFAMSRESIDRQRRLTINKEVAARSLDGQLGEGGKGSLYPTFLLRNAFEPDRPMRLTQAEIATYKDAGYEFISMFDHAASGDLNVVQTWAVPWPPFYPDRLIGRFHAVGLAERRSSGALTVTLQVRFLLDEIERYDPKAVVVDATSEGGILVYRGVREALPNSAADCRFQARAEGQRVSNKELGLQLLQRMLSWGLDAIADEDGWVGDWPETDGRDFGLLRLPSQGPWRRLSRELAVLRRDDEKQRQDRAMTAVMGAWFLRTYLGRTRPTTPSAFNIVGRRTRPKRWAMAGR